MKTTCRLPPPVGRPRGSVDPSHCKTHTRLTPSSTPGAECQPITPGFQLGGEIFLLTFPFIESLTLHRSIYGFDARDQGHIDLPAAGRRLRCSGCEALERLRQLLWLPQHNRAAERQ